MSTDLAPISNEISEITPSAMESIARAEVDIQIATAKRYPRSISQFVNTLTEMATRNEETAASCYYTLPRGGKAIEGKSVRLAEMAAQAWGNLQFATRIAGNDGKFLTVQVVVWDLQTNLKAAVEIQRKITDRNGTKFNDDMINMAAMAAQSIGRRNGIFMVIPGSLLDEVYHKCKQLVRGEISTLVDRRGKVIDALLKLGVEATRIYSTVGVKGLEDIGLDELEQLRGLGAAVRNGEVNIDVAFPAPVAEGDKPDMIRGQQAVADKIAAQRAEEAAADTKRASTIDGEATVNTATGEILPENGTETPQEAAPVTEQAPAAEPPPAPKTTAKAAKQEADTEKEKELSAKAALITQLQAKFPTIKLEMGIAQQVAKLTNAPQKMKLVDYSVDTLQAALDAE